MNSETTKRGVHHPIPHVKYSFQDFYNLLCQHGTKSICAFVLVLSGAFVLCLVSPKTYQSQSLFYVRLGRENVRLDPTTTMGQASMISIPNSRESEIKSIVEILKSRAIAEKVVDALGPERILGEGLDGEQSARSSSDMEAIRTSNLAMQKASGLFQLLGLSVPISTREKAISELSKSFVANSLDKTDLLSLSFRAGTPTLAQQVVQKYTEIYLEQHTKLNHPPHALKFLEQQTSRLADELGQSESKLKKLKQETNLASPQTQRELLVTRLSRLEDELLTTEAIEMAMKSEIEVLDMRLGSLSVRRVDAVTTGLSNPASDGMRQSLYALQMQQKKLEGIYAAKHPTLFAIRDQIAQSEEVFSKAHEERQTITESPNRTFEDLNITRLRQESLLSSTSAKAVSLRTQIDEAKSQFQTHIANELEISKIEREVQLQDVGYRKYCENLEQARIDQALEGERISNINVIQPASISDKPVGPNVLLILMAGMFCAILAAFGVVFVADAFDHSTESSKDVEEKLNLPLLV